VVVVKGVDIVHGHPSASLHAVRMRLAEF